jgi:hypothetical protein
MPISEPAVIAWPPGHAHQPAHRCHRQAEQALQRDGRAGGVRQQAEDGVGEMHQRYQHDQHGDDVQQ